VGAGLRRWRDLQGAGAHGIPSVATDLVDRGYGTARRDFLLELKPPDGRMR
jgi:hypothetical protein